MLTCVHYIQPVQRLPIPPLSLKGLYSRAYGASSELTQNPQDSNLDVYL